MTPWAILRCLLIAALVAILGHQPGARADEVSSSVQRPTEPAGSGPLTSPADPRSFALELGLGLDAPLGNVGTALVFRPLPSVALVAGIGWHTLSYQPGGSHAFRFALGTRVTLFRWNALSLGVGAGVSRGREKEVRTYRASGYQDATVQWKWERALRLDGDLFFELPVGSGRLGLTAGTGWILTRPDDGTAPGDNLGSTGDTYDFAPRVFRPYLGVRFSQDFSEPAAATDSVPRSTEGPLGSDDPASGRAFLSPTALTAPAGTWTIGTVAVVGLGITYAFSERVEAEVDVFPIASGVAAARLKVAVVKSGRLRLAALAVLGDYGFGILDVVVGGMVASLCVDTDCKLLLSAYGIFGYGRGMDGDEPVSPSAFLLGPSLRMRLARHLAAFAETHLITEVDVWSGSPRPYNLSAGLRFYPRAQWAFEIGATSLDGKTWPIGSVTYRTSQ